MGKSDDSMYISKQGLLATYIFEVCCRDLVKVEARQAPVVLTSQEAQHSQYLPRGQESIRT